MSELAIKPAKTTPTSGMKLKTVTVSVSPKFIAWLIVAELVPIPIGHS